MDFKYKCYLQKVLSSIPKGEKLNFLIQKYITKKYPVTDKKFIQIVLSTKVHFDNFVKYRELPGDKEFTCYEFGAGWDLINPIGLSLLGIKRQYCIDIRQLVFPELLNDTIEKFRRLRKDLTFEYPMPENVPLITAENFRSILSDCFGIFYEAPMDARVTAFESSSVDLIVSNLTFEHIPECDIQKIFEECYRILKPGGIFSCVIDYRDHWSYFDSTISIYNFLKYSPEQWKRYNPSLHYQNRLRHSDYLSAIRQTCFEVVVDDPAFPSEEELESLKTLSIHSDFSSRYTIEELAIKESRMVLKK